MLCVAVLVTVAWWGLSHALLLCIQKQKGGHVLKLLPAHTSVQSFLSIMIWPLPPLIRAPVSDPPPLLSVYWFVGLCFF